MKASKMRRKEIRENNRKIREKWANNENKVKLEATQDYLKRVASEYAANYVVSPITFTGAERRLAPIKTPKYRKRRKNKLSKKARIALRRVRKAEGVFKEWKLKYGRVHIENRCSDCEGPSSIQSTNEYYPISGAIIANEGDYMYNLAGEYEVRNVEFGHGRRKTNEWNDKVAFGLKDKLKEEREARENGWI